VAPKNGRRYRRPYPMWIKRFIRHFRKHAAPCATPFFPSDPPSEEGSPGVFRSRCPTTAAFWPASLATGPAGLPQRGVSAGFRSANGLAERRANGRDSGEPSARRAGEAGHASLGTFLSCNKKVPRLPGRDPARAWKRRWKVGAGDTAAITGRSLDSGVARREAESRVCRDRRNDGVPRVGADATAPWSAVSSRP
jgi:hypothetical protein